MRKRNPQRSRKWTINTMIRADTIPILTAMITITAMDMHMHINITITALIGVIQKLHLLRLAIIQATLLVAINLIHMSIMTMPASSKNGPNLLLENMSSALIQWALAVP